MPAQEPVRLEAVEVIGVTPTHGLGVPRTQIPANVQAADSEEVDEATFDITDFMNRSLSSVHVNQVQNNPLQPDVNYRGFTASPLLGLPQGISVYQDGVRLNEPFGDVVNWDLIPLSAVAEMQLMPGSNPLFGRNTLGGALSLRTKNGFTHPGSEGRLYGGSFGRRVLEAQTGGSGGEHSYFLTGEYFEEDGWRDFSPSEAARLFANLGWQGAAASWDLSLSAGDSELIGNGAAPVQLLARDREAIFTRPDRTRNELAMLTLRGTRAMGDDVVLEGNVFFRKNDVDTLNGDDTDYEACEEPANAGLLCSEADAGEQVVFDQNGNPVAATEAVSSATVNTSATDQQSYGTTLQASFLQPLAGRENTFIVGAVIEQADADFSSQTELGRLDATRQAEGSGLLDADSFVAVDTRTRNYSLYASDILSLTDALTLTVSARYNRTEVELDDRVGEALSGDHTFDRLNPALGLTYSLSPRLNLFAGYSESNRAPTPVELTCADEDDPCRLPNAFVSDPPLDDVVAETWEVGVRGGTPRLGYSLALFRTTNRDDILFISAGALTNEGFFDNVGDTRRQGVELGLQGRAADLEWFLAYTYLEATFRTPLAIASENHPLAVDGEIQVERGDRIPGMPRHLLKAGGDYALTPRLSVGVEALYNSDQVLRGDEANQLESVDGYAVVNLRGAYRLSERVKLFARVDNVFDEEYETFGLLGEADEVLGEDFDDPRFLGPGAPRGAWLGVQATF